MSTSGMTRRNYLATLGAGATAAAAITSIGCKQAPVEAEQTEKADLTPPPDHERRIQWWREAKFGMFIHWGLYSVLGRHEWAMEEEGIPVAEYEQLAKQFKPKPYPARDWAKLAKRAGMKYMVMTSKHHEGFCHFDSKLTNYSSPKQGPGRDLAKEFLDAARAEGLRCGFYYSLMDWHHPDGARCATDEQARRRFVDYIHGQIRELCTNYGKLDVLWYDVAWPLDAKGWESQKMNDMVLSLQPDILVNNRNLLPGDFGTPEQEIVAAKQGRDWEACMTMNDSWGYHKADDDWKSPKTIVRNLVTCARDGGNYLLNIGPKADGSIPEESVRILDTVGAWMDKNNSTIHGAERCNVRSSEVANFTRKGNTLYIHVHFWPGETVSIGGLQTKIKSAKLLAGGKPVQFKQEEFRVQFTGLPAAAPDNPVTVIAAECESEPTQDMLHIRKNRPRREVGI
ncbi:MAG TPA: alpha-L-fucosidase [Bryobacteraceae bacterium]|nr:alpha-L-fucosidase [Bryobacteraceae bacterium]